MRLALLMVLVLVAGCSDAPTSEAPATDELREAVAASTPVRFETSKGPIDLIVYQELMPEHGERFLELVRSGFYDGTHIHRVVDDFVIQGGDPTGLGEGGSGTTIPHEHHPLLPFATGALGMARDQDPDTADSQWFITERPVLRLSDPESDTAKEWGTFAMFGQVVHGMDVVQDIADETTVPTTQRPLIPVFVERAYIADFAWDPRDYPLAAAAVEATTAVQPLHLFDGHLFTITVYTTAAAVTVSFDGPGGSHVLELDAAEPGRFVGQVVLAGAGAWERTVQAGDVTIRDVHEVRAASGEN